MSFRVAPLESRDCGRHCPDVIVADGVIEAETPQAFVDFLKSGSADTKLRRIVFFNSRGGNVVASMVFGHILRGLRIAGVVGRFEAAGDPGPYRWRMPVGVRLRADGRGPPGRASRQRSRASSDVDR